MILLLATLAFATPPDAAPAGPALHTRVVEMLSGIETTPSAAAWQALGPAAELELETIARDAAMLPTQRGNALAALANFPTEAAHTLLVTTLADTTTDRLFRRKACSGLAHGWGAAAVPELAAALADNDVIVRQAAARALSKVADPSATAALKARLAVETDSSVTSILKKAVAK